MKKMMQNWITIFWLSVKGLFREKLTYRASALSFTTLLAIVPLITVIFFFISLFPIFNRYTQLAENYIFANFIPTSSNVIQFYLNNFVEKAHALPAIGMLFLLITVIMLIITIEHSLNEIWCAPKRRKKIRVWLLYWLILISSPLFIGLSVLVSSYVFSLSWLMGTANKLGLAIYILALFPLLINTLIFSLLYIVVPNCQVNWRDGIYGGLTAAIIFECAKKFFAIYIIKFPSYELIYGVLATVPIFLLWIYISWIIVLFGALITRSRFEMRNKNSKKLILKS